MKNNGFKKIQEIFREYLQQGLTPREISLAVVISISMAIIPFLGVNTALLALIAFSLKLNFALIQSINLVLWPLQIALFIPFAKLGTLIFKNNYIPLSFEQFYLTCKTDFFKTLLDSWRTIVQALGAWIIVVTPVAVILYFILNNLLKRLNITYSGNKITHP